MGKAGSDNDWRKTRKGGLCLLLVTLLACLALAEVYLRLTSPYIIRKTTPALTGNVVAGDYSYFMDTLSGRRLIPGTRVAQVIHDRTIDIDINAHGFRGEDIPPEKQPGETRILFLGDSITFGADTPQRLTYVQRTEDYLAGETPPGRVRLINGGVEGIGLEDEIDILVDQGLGIDPDIVVVGFFLNDGNPPDRLAAGLANPNFIRRHSVLAQTIFRAYKFHQYRKGEMEEANMHAWLGSPAPADWQTNRESLLRFAAVAGKDWGSAWNPETWVGIEKQFKRLESLAGEHAFKVVVVSFPVVFQVYSRYIEDEPQRRLQALSARHGFDFFDLLPVLRAERQGKSLINDWCHLSDEGHDVVGKALARVLLGKLNPGDRRGRAGS